MNYHLVVHSAAEVFLGISPTISLQGVTNLLMIIFYKEFRITPISRMAHILYTMLSIYQMLIPPILKREQNVWGSS